MKYTPAFNFQGQRFVIADQSYLADTEGEADRMAIGVMFYEGILFGFQRDGESPIQQVPESKGEGRFVADAATLQGKDLDELAIYVNIREEEQWLKSS